ncbi:MAG: branched-chain amino acid transaminase [Calditrichaeota bacterium]|nr:branched-chain amino acid transaminase [Calditrichota bacterium]
MSSNRFPGAKVYWHQGSLHDWNERQVHVMSHVLHYGSSVFEGIRAYETERGPAIFRLKEHVERLFHSARFLKMKVPYSYEEIFETCRLILRENRVKSAYIRPNLFFGYGNLGITPSACPVELTVACWEWGAYLGEDAIRNGIHALLIPQKRIHWSQVDASVKVGGLYVQSNVFATQTRNLGYNEAIFLNLEERISEGPGENLILVKDGVLHTNDRFESILEGVTRTSILELARDRGHEVRVAPIEIQDLFDADEAFFTGTAAEVTPICRVTDSRDAEKSQSDWPIYQIGAGKPGPITREMGDLYQRVVRGLEPQYDHWLTYAYDSAEEAREALYAEAFAK